MTRLPALIAALVYTGLAAFANPAHARPLTEAERAEEAALRDGDMRKLVVHETPVPAPGTVFTDAAGAEMSLADSNGRVRLVNFWATWCAPCRIASSVARASAARGSAAAGFAKAVSAV
jgi:thiol-disulfide isomerase/thioredoxin